jgi:hypothetical protein
MHGTENLKYRFYVTSTRLLSFNSTFIVIIVIKVIRGGGISSPKIYFPKSYDFNLLKF